MVIIARNSIGYDFGYFNLYVMSCGYSLARVRDLVLYACFASRPRATGSFCVTASPSYFIRTFCVSLVGMIFIAPFLALSNTV